MVKPYKEQAVAEIKERLENSKGIVITDYRGLNVAEATELRKKLREAGVDYKVLKNTLTWIAAQQIGLNDLEDYLKGPTAIAFNEKDPVTPAKILIDFAKDHKALEIKGGVVEGKVVDAKQVKDLADLPSREVLIAQVLAGMQAPIAGFVTVLNGLPRNLVYALDQIRQKKEA